MKCWLCGRETDIKETDYGDHKCPYCGVQVSVYNLADQQLYEPNGSEREEQMILGGKFLKVADCKTGDTIEFIDEGVWEESRSFKNDDGTPKHQCQFQIKHGGEEKTITLNKTNREALIAVWGRDTTKWIGKLAEITLKDVEVAGEDKTVIRLKAVA